LERLESEIRGGKGLRGKGEYFWEGCDRGLRRGKNLGVG
jgi:hypothetical protein